MFFIEHVIYYAASREITISTLLHRNFWWQRNVLWLEDLPCSVGVVVAVSGRDEILNPTSTMEYVNICSQERLLKNSYNYQKKAYNLRSCGMVNDSDDHLSPTDGSNKKAKNIVSLFWPGYSHG